MESEEEARSNREEENQDGFRLGDLEACPRCGEPIPLIIWGLTNCPRCGLHFECC